PFRYPQLVYFHRVSAGNPAIGARLREAGMDKLDHVADRESVRLQDAFGTAIIAGREQFKRADAIGLGVTPAMAGPHSLYRAPTALNRHRDTPFQRMEPNSPLVIR